MGRGERIESLREHGEIKKESRGERKRDCLPALESSAPRIIKRGSYGTVRSPNSSFHLIPTIKQDL